METQFRPCGMVVQIADATASGLTLRDTEGEVLKCNFISVEASGENPDAYFRVGMDAQSQATPVSNYKTAALSLGVTTSGVIGGYASVNKGVVEFLLADGDRTDTINLQLDEAGSCNFFINYGQIQHGNGLRDNNRPNGN